MEKESKVEVSAQERKDIYAFRKKRREDKLNQSTSDDYKSDVKKVMDEYMEDKLPYSHTYFKYIEKAADSFWFAWSELRRFHEHYHQNHKDKYESGKDSECGQGCLEDFTMVDAKEFAQKVYESVVQFYEKESKEQNEGR